MTTSSLETTFNVGPAPLDPETIREFRFSPEGVDSSADRRRLVWEVFGVDDDTIAELESEILRMPGKQRFSYFISDLERRVLENLGQQLVSATEFGGPTTGSSLTISLAPIPSSMLLVGALNDELKRLASIIVAAEETQADAPRETEAPDRRRSIDERSADVGIRRLRYQSPLEIALAVPAVLLGSQATLAALIFGVRRIYGADLEIRTHRHELRAAFFEARKRARDAERAWRADQPPEMWTPEMVETLRVLSEERKGTPNQLEPEKVTLVEDEG